MPRKKLRTRKKLNPARSFLSEASLKSINVSILLANGFEECPLILERVVKFKKCRRKKHKDKFYWIGYPDLVGYISTDGFSLVFDSSMFVGGIIPTQKWKEACSNLGKKGKRSRLY